MKWVKLLLAVCFLGIGILVIKECSEKPTQQQQLVGRFLKNGSLLIEGTKGTTQVSVFDSNNTLVASKQTFGRPSTQVSFSWNPDSTYTITSDINPYSISIQAPQTKPEFVIRLHAPLGQTPHSLYFNRACQQSSPVVIPFPVPENGMVDLMMEVENLTNHGKFQFDLMSTLVSEDSLTLIPEMSHKNAELSYEFEKKIWTTHLKMTTGETKRLLKVVLVSPKCKVQLDLNIVTHQVGPDSIALSQWQVPTDDLGLFSPQHSMDHLVMPNRIWKRIATLFGVPPRILSFYEPFAYQAFTIQNRSKQPVSFLVKSEILDITTKQPVPYFNAPKTDATGGTGKIIGFVETQSGQSSRAVLPLFIKPDIKAGRYLRRISVTPMGEEIPLKIIEKELLVDQSNNLYTIWVLTIIVVSLGWLVVIVAMYRRLINSLGVRLIVLLSLLGSLQFCLSFVSSIISGISYAVLGPFNCLVGGLFSEVMLYLITTAILFLVPRVGAMTIAGMVSYIMGGIMFGSFGITDILLTGSSIAFKELFLFGFGITSFRPVHTQPPNILLMMIALGLADAASTFTSLVLHSVFYRLFFANWYFILQVGITGFLYTALGVYLGKIMGENLRKVHI